MKILLLCVALISYTTYAMNKVEEHENMFKPLHEFLASECNDFEMSKKNKANPEVERKQKTSAIIEQMENHLKTMKKFYCGENYYIAPEVARSKPALLKEEMVRLLNQLEATHTGKPVKDDVNRTNY